MLTSQTRISKKKEVEYIFKTGKSSFDNILGIKYINNNLDFSRLMVVVSTKVSKKAVVRNKIKRRIKELFKIQLQKNIKNIDCVVITLPLIKDKEYNEIEESIEKHFQKLRLYK